MSRQEAEGFPVATLVRAMGLSRQAYYAWRHRAERGPDPTEARLGTEIRAIATRAPGHLRQPSDHPRAPAAAAARVHHKRVERLMGKLGIYVTTPKRFRAHYPARGGRTVCRPRRLRTSPLESRTGAT